MKRHKYYPPEVREQAVRLVLEHREDYHSQWATLTSIVGKIGCAAETLRNWVRRAEVDLGKRAGLTSPERERIRELERENRELKQANEILRKASAFFSLGKIIIGLYKTELLRKPRRPWKTLDDLEYATLEWVDWFNHRRLLAPIGNVLPAEYEKMHYDGFNRSCKAA